MGEGENDEQEEAELIKGPKERIIMEPKAQEIVKITLTNSGNVPWSKDT